MNNIWITNEFGSFEISDFIDLLKFARSLDEHNRRELFNYSQIAEYLKHECTRSDFTDNHYINDYSDRLIETADGHFGTEMELLESNYVYCRYSYEWVHVDETIVTEDTGKVVSKEYAERNFYYSEIAGAFYEYYEDSPEHQDEEDEDDNSNFVSSYHSGSPMFYTFKGDEDRVPYLVGIEFEKEDREVKTSINIQDFKNKFYHWRKESDGSLDDYSGFELISPAFEYDVARIIDYIKSESVLLEHVNAETSSRCGGHINVSKEYTSIDSLYDDIKHYIPLLYAMYPSRKSGTYCEAKKIDEMKNERRKYSAVYIKPYAIEFRIFPAIKNIDQLEFRLNLVRLFLNNPVSDFASALNVIESNYDTFSSVYNKVKFAALLNRYKKEIQLELESQLETV